MRILLATVTLAASSVTAPAHAASVLTRTVMFYHRQGAAFIVVLDCEALTLASGGAAEAPALTGVECQLGGLTNAAFAPGPVAHAVVVNILLPPFETCVTGRATMVDADPAGTYAVPPTKVCDVVEQL